MHMHPFNLHIHGDRPTVYMMYMYIQSLVMHLLISTQCSGFMLNVFWYVFAILQLYTAYVYIYIYIHMGNYNDLIAISLKWLVREIITKYPRIIVIHIYIRIYIYTYTYIHIYIYMCMLLWFCDQQLHKCSYILKPHHITTCHMQIYAV